jgi:hypothetical protein
LSVGNVTVFDSRIIRLTWAKMKKGDDPRTKSGDVQDKSCFIPPATNCFQGDYLIKRRRIALMARKKKSVLNRTRYVRLKNGSASIWPVVVKRDNSTK